LHGGLVNLCRVLASHQYTALQRQLERTLACEAVFDEAAQWVAEHKDEAALVAPSVIDVRGEHVQAAMYQFVVWWMGCGGMAGTDAKPRMSKRWGPGGGICSTRFAKAVASCESIHNRLKKVDIRCMDLFDLLPKIKDQAGITVYIDPPWRIGGKAYTFNWHQPAKAGVGGLFSADTKVRETMELYQRLRDALGRFKATRVVMRHEADASIQQLFSGSQWWTIGRPRNKGLTSAAGKAGGGSIDEMLILNQPPIETNMKAGA
ncbi:MAG: hypothetical protein ACPGYV_13590, partial [Phycisphaeraceae bacterium]